ncbi:16S rRNA methyltransferase [Brevirhabdus pacifica]|uniref:16S rRNA methyltransferase n=1 Tax=Brevirhabdus pacifica TaxID=1267768 RepID=A0A1U7DI91_9RHOB|nr:transcription antitermination factor NusB [Brevirhabdus pacifica]APX89706.1 16S rRNA methyltransferase [Brevirhabdus pacifica]OWU74548.1 16S rRNA methyltransferase [Loktanella sp. 22II-4b]PJJ85607.1 16S rRNA (cytosine967-C5)-methyltransferase [Brevirhabdus pacifica]
MAKAGLAARKAAAEIVVGVTADGRSLMELQDVLERLEPADRARAGRLATTALRHLGRTDRVLAPHMRKRPPAFTLAVLRLATVEICHEGAAPHGVVDSAVALVRGHARQNRMSGLVNAILRKVAEEGPARWAAQPPDRLPKWLRQPLRRAWGDAAVARMERVHASHPPVDLTLRDPSRAEALAEALPAGSDGAEGDGAAVEVLPTGSLRLAEPGRISSLPGYAEGEWWVQDAAAALAARMLDVRPGEKVLDLCAAPGGKTMQLAAAGAEVTALDLSPARLERLRQNLERTGLEARVVAGDALAFAEGPFDAILLDAPCSATGTIRRHPDLPHAKATRDLSAVTELQARLLDHALSLLAPGGRLVFCTCSLLPEEGEAQTVAALARHPGLRVDEGWSLDGIDPAWRSAEGGLRLRPDLWEERGGMDGFYMVRFQR